MNLGALLFSSGYEVALIAHNVAHTSAKYARVARLLGVDTRGMDADTAANRAVDRARELVASVGIPSRLSGFGVSEADFPAIIEGSLPSGSLKHNPRPLGAADVRAILAAAL